MRHYRSNDGTVLGRLIEFFRANPDETLTCKDAWIKFDGPSMRSVQDAMRKGAAAGWFACEGNPRGGAGHELVYSAGPKLTPP